MTKQGVRARLAAAAVLGAAALAGFPAAAQASGTVHYAPQDASATHVVLKGKPTKGGCEFTMTGSGSATRHTAVRQVETAYDAATCTSYLDRATVVAAAESPAAAAAPAQSGGSGRGGAARALISEGAVSARVAYCYNPYRSTGSFTSDACVHSWFQNPSGVHVNDVRNEVQWNPYGGCATYGPSYASYNWLAASGWYNTLDQFSSSFFCSGVTSQSRESFTHNTYCSGTASSVTYDPGYVTGHADGSYNWSVTWRKTGSCSLSFGLLDES